MKKIVLLMTALISILLITMTSFAMSYSEWYLQQFGDWPEGTVSEWENDPVYWGYLQQYDPEELARLQSGQRTEPVINSGNGGDVDGDHAWITDAYWSGKTAKWKVAGSASKYQVRLHRNNSSSTIASYTVTSKSQGFSSDITRDGDYWFEVRPYSKYTKQWEGWYSSDESYFRGSGSDSPSGPSSYGTNGWISSPGGWQYYENGYPARNKWILYANNWYWFDANGTMLTGWQWINRQCYYLNPNPNGGPIPYGACWMNGTTPDGYTVNASGAWTVNGVVQVR